MGRKTRDRRRGDFRTSALTIGLALLALVGAAPLRGQVEALETKDLRLIYFGGIHSFLAPYLSQCFENALAQHCLTFGYQPREKITVFLHDFNDYGNGGASAVPNDRVFIAMAPLNYVMDIIPGNERLNWMMHHELVHIITTDQAHGSDRFFRALFFGKVEPSADQPLSMLYSYLTNPRDCSPSWYKEGIATFMETWRSGGHGRAQSSYDEMVFRALVGGKGRIYDLLGLESAATRINFQVGVNAYLYGTRFDSYLALRYGPENLIRWVSRRAGSKASFAAQFRAVYGMPLRRAWGEWISWEKEFQKANLERLGATPLTPCQPLTRRPLGYVSRPFWDPEAKRIYVAVNYPGQVAYIAAIDPESGTVRKLHSLKGPDLFFVTSLAFDRRNGVLFFTNDNDDWRDLLRLDLRSGRAHKLMHDCRIGDLAFNAADGSLWGVRHYNGISTLVRIPPPFRKWHQVYSWPYGQDVFDIDISPDGALLAAALTEPSGRQSLIKMETTSLLAGTPTIETISDFENSSPADFVFAGDSRTLYGSSTYSGVANIYRCDLQTKEIQVLSNTDTGLFHPLPYSADELLAFRYTADGFLPVKIPMATGLQVQSIAFLGQEIVNKYPQLKAWKAPPPSAVDIKAATLRQGKYSLFGHMAVRSIIPIVEGYKESAAIGLHASLSDPVGLNSLDLTASYSPDAALAARERLHLKAALSLSALTFTATHNNADFYDLFGNAASNTKTSFKGQSLAVQYKKNLIFDEPSRSSDYSLELAGYFNLERLPDYQNVAAAFERLFSLSLNYDYKYMRTSLGAIDYEKGLQFQGFLGSYYVNSRLYPRLHAELDLGLPLPLRHSSLWLRGSAGRVFGDRGEPFANFYFGGFGNNWLDHRSAKRYRSFFSFPGTEINALSGRTYGKLLLEWNLPPLVFKQLGVPSFYANWLGASFFAGGLLTDPDSSRWRRRIADAGGQVDIRIMMLSTYQFTLSAGYAWAFESGKNTTHEWMVSLKIH
jgi:hypothetical protein